MVNDNNKIIFWKGINLSKNVLLTINENNKNNQC